MDPTPDPSERPTPAWLIDEPYNDVDLGVLRSGKEAQISLIERTGADGRTGLVARKRYLPRQVANKGELEALGVQRASTFRNDVEYREGRQFRKSRDRRAVERMTEHGKRLLQSRWTGHEHETMAKLWAAGLAVPYPIGYDEDLFDLEYLGDRDGAAPQLRSARLDRAAIEGAYEQLVDGLSIMVSEGIVHGDLSAYNLLWWDERLWFIDFPQAVDLAANPQGVGYLHHDVTNISRWFTSRGYEVDGEELFARLLARL